VSGATDNRFYREKSVARDDGGPAYPVEGLRADGKGGLRLLDGMTLRDAFAMNAPLTIEHAATACGAPIGRLEYWTKDRREALFKLLAAMRYEWADAMLAERAK
jgi:hypothetical protein